MKNILAVTALLALVSWGIYDLSSTNPSVPPKAEQNAMQADIKIGIEKGNMAPDFELQTLDGKKIKLSDFKGKKLIVNLWASWCPPCRAEMPDMQAFYEEHHKEDFAILAVNLTQSEKSSGNVSAFIEEFGLTFPVVLDVDNKISDQYQAVSIPTSYIIDSKGIIKQKIIGPMDKETIEKLMSSIE